MVNRPIDFQDDDLNREYTDILESIRAMLAAFNNSLEEKGLHKNKRARAAGLIFSPEEERDDEVTDLIGVPGAVTEESGASTMATALFAWECHPDIPECRCLYKGQEVVFCFKDPTCRRLP